MKFKSFLVFLLLSFFFLGTQSSAFGASDTSVVGFDITIEVSEQVEETEDKRNFFSFAEGSYITFNSCAISYDSFLSSCNYFIDIYKPPTSS